MGTPEKEKNQPVSFRVVYHPLVSEDLKHVPRNLQLRLEMAIRYRLAQTPQSYGKPLTGNLAGHWKMRVGDYRIVFKIVQNEMRVLGVIHRKDVYSKIIKRFFWQH